MRVGIQPSFKVVLYGVLVMVVGLVAFYVLTAVGRRVEQVPSSNTEAQASPTSGETRDLEIVTLLPKDAIPAILEPEFVSAKEADPNMTNGEYVIGVVFNGDARAYPINMLSRHEIVNDVVGGKPIAVTW